ncbi:MAG: AtpZ/AtpI family protein [Bryobacteraceae bacterium]|nr:AtpZ/AtpI family protein [Bryobacteraceae bacterium]
MPDPGRRDGRSFWIKYGEYSQLAFALPASIGVGWLIGTWLDTKFGTSFLYLVFILIGIAGGLIQVVRFVQRDKN